jgi:hypothetical protein
MKSRESEGKTYSKCEDNIKMTFRQIGRVWSNLIYWAQETNVGFL